ncbi:Holliday junction resolvase RuvX [Candidatus Falkowbacteria bacterium]|nr:Holliday junction resolvase RuvX [Candidatus Falkowbacteria bacterium]
MKYLGIDWGEKRIGLALGDDETKIATPFKVVGGLEEVLKVIREEEIDVMVVGKPISIFNFQFSIFNKKFNKFIEELRKKAGVSVEFMDERLTSKAADALGGTKKTKAPRDAVAAMLILQSYFDPVRGRGRSSS